MAEAEPTSSAQTGATNGQSPWAAAQRGGGEEDDFARRPEIYVGAALLGGVVLAQVLKRLAGDD